MKQQEVFVRMTWEGETDRQMDRWTEQWGAWLLFYCQGEVWVQR